MLHRLMYLGMACMATGGEALAQSPAAWPARNVTVVTPFVPGGSTEVDFRAFLPYLNKTLGQLFVLDYKPGGGTTIGTTYVAKDPDVRKVLEPAGAILVGSTPAEFKAVVTEEINFTKNIVKELGIKPEV